MALTYAERIAQTAEHHAWHDVHGYSQPHRGSGGTETIKYTDGTTATVTNSDLDCSEMDRQCANAAISGSYKGPIPDMWSGNADQRLKAVGFTRIPFSTGAVRRGDLLWRTGHMGVALGSGRQADAHGDEVGGITGPIRGDQTTHEIEVRALRTNWTYIYRKEGSPVAYTNSKLASEFIYTPKQSGLRNHAIDTITVHYIVGYSYARDVAIYLRDAPDRTASANYIIGKVGDIVLNVEEKNRSWCSSSGANDNRAITIECANYLDSKDGHVYGQLPDKTWESLVALCADVCKRNGKTRLVYTGKTSYSTLKSNEMLLTKHKWFANTDCPGPWLDNKFNLLCNRVNALLKPPEQNPGKAANDYGLKYRVHQQSAGWLPAVHDGQVAGITGNALRMEAIKITPPDGVELEVLLHIQGIGDKVWRGIRKGKSSGTGTSANDPIMGTVGKAKRVEGISIEVSKNSNAKLKGKTLYYRVHVQKQGWTKWVKAGTYAGTRGKALRVEAIQMKFQ